jgi:hypothetical protein
MTGSPPGADTVVVSGWSSWSAMIIRSARSDKTHPGEYYTNEQYDERRQPPRRFTFIDRDVLLNHVVPSGHQRAQDFVARSVPIVPKEEVVRRGVWEARNVEHPVDAPADARSATTAPICTHSQVPCTTATTGRPTAATPRITDALVSTRSHASRTRSFRSSNSELTNSRVRS